MSLFQALKERRLVQIVVAYATAGWIALSVISQFVEMGIVPMIFYRVALVLYVGGLFASCITGWFHGEKGHQEWTRPELGMLSLVAVLTLVGSGYVIMDYRETARQAELIADSALELRRIGVLYFDDRSRGEDRTYLAEGITTGLIGELSRVRELDVLSANASAQVRDMDATYDSIARVLDAGVLVDGTIQEAGGNVRINAVLVDGSSGTDLGEFTVEQPADEVLALQDDLVDQIAERLREILGTEVRLAESRAETSSPQAWTDLQRGERAWSEARAMFNEGDDAGAAARLMIADSLFASAAAADDAWAEPWVARARVARSNSGVLIFEDPSASHAAIDQGLVLAEEALSRDPGNAGALEVRGELRYYLWDFGFLVDPAEASATFQSAIDDLEAAVDRDPSRATAWAQLSQMYSEEGDNIQANQAARRAYEADQFLASAPQVLFRLYATSYDAELFPQALEYCEEAHRRFPDIYQFTECRLWLTATRALPDDPDAAWATLDEYLALVPDQLEEFERSKGETVVAMVIARASVAAESRDQAAAQALADSALAVARRARAGPDVDPTQELRSLEALVFLELGDTDRAMDLLQAYLMANPEHREGFRTAHWWWRDLQNVPEFLELVGG